MHPDTLAAFVRAIVVEGRAPGGTPVTGEAARAWMAERPIELVGPLRALAAQTAARWGGAPGDAASAVLTAGSIGVAAAAAAIAASLGPAGVGLDTAEALTPLVPVARGWDVYAYHGVLKALQRSLPAGSPARFATAALVARSPLSALVADVDPGEEGRTPAVELLRASSGTGAGLAAAVVRAWVDGPDEPGAWRWRAWLLEVLETVSTESTSSLECLLSFYGHLALRLAEEADDPLARADLALRDPVPDPAALTHATAVAAALAPLARLRRLGPARLRASGVPGGLAVRAGRLQDLMRWMDAGRPPVVDGAPAPPSLDPERASAVV